MSLIFEVCTNYCGLLLVNNYLLVSIIGYNMLRRIRNIAHPGIRQFIIRTAVINYLGKSLQMHWDDWQNQRMYLRTLQESLMTENPGVAETARVALLRTIDELSGKVAASRNLLQREYNALYDYVLDKRDLWDSPEYFNAQSALGMANQHLRMYK